MFCLPVVMLGFGAALTHLLRDGVAHDVPEVVPAPVLYDVARTVSPAVSDAVPIPVPEVTTEAVARHARRRPVDHARKAERSYAADLADGRVPSLRTVMRDLRFGQPEAREVRKFARAKLAGKPYEGPVSLDSKACESCRKPFTPKRSTARPVLLGDLPQARQSPEYGRACHAKPFRGPVNGLLTGLARNAFLPALVVGHTGPFFRG
jgi:hypothetical protein